MEKSIKMLGIGSLLALLLVIGVAYADTCTQSCHFDRSDPDDNDDNVAVSPKGEGAPPSLSGWNTLDSDRVQFSPVSCDTTFVMSTTEIMILNGCATERFVNVFFDGELIETIDNGRAPGADFRETWLGFGGKFVDIPFDKYYMVTDEGELLSLGQYNQNRSIGPDGTVQFLDSEDDVIEEISPVMTLAQYKAAFGL